MKKYTITGLDPDTLLKFQTLCKQRGTDAAKELRRIIEQYVKKYDVNACAKKEGN